MISFQKNENKSLEKKNHFTIFYKVLILIQLL